MGRECDLLCIGGGLGGLAAALRAADAALDVLIVEKSPRIGGVAAYSGGVVWVGNNHLQRQAGLDDSEQKTSEYLRWVARDAGPFDDDLLETFIRRAPEAAEYFARLDSAFPGCRRFRLAANYRSSPYLVRAGRSLIGPPEETGGNGAGAAVGRGVIRLVATGSEMSESGFGWISTG